MSTTTAMPNIANLSVSEKLQLIGELWDSLNASQDQLPIPQWHKDELDARHEEFGRDGGTLSLADVDALVGEALCKR